MNAGSRPTPLDPDPGRSQITRIKLHPSRRSSAQPPPPGELDRESLRRHRRTGWFDGSPRVASSDSEIFKTEIFKTEDFEFEELKTRSFKTRDFRRPAEHDQRVLAPHVAASRCSPLHRAVLFIQCASLVSRTRHVVRSSHRPWSSCPGFRAADRRRTPHPAGIFEV